MRLVLAGTSLFGLPSFSILLADPTVEVVGVISQSSKPVGRHQEVSPTPVAIWAKDHDLPLLSPKNWRETAALATLQQWRPEVIVVAAYGLIVPTTVLMIPSRGCLNIHASLLPAYRGASPIVAAILHGDVTTGITFMQMDAGMDTGPILSQHACPILPTDTTPLLTEQLADLAATKIMSVIHGFNAGYIEPLPQPSGATYAKKIQRQDGQVTWQSAGLVERQLRAYQPWPGVWATWRGHNIKFLGGSILSSAPKQSRGTIISTDAGWGVVCDDGVFVPTTVQFSGKRPQPAESIPGSYPGFVGSRFAT